MAVSDPMLFYVESVTWIQGIGVLIGGGIMIYWRIKIGIGEDK